MLSSVRDLLGSRFHADGQPFGWVRDIYFDDQEWAIRCVVVSLGGHHRTEDLRLIEPSPALCFEPESRTLRATIPASAVPELPLASSVKPVCKQYENFAYGSPASRPGARSADPHLRSWREVSAYHLHHGGENAGMLGDLLFHRGAWTIASLEAVWEFAGKRLHFHLCPASVERISWAAQKIFLRELHPIHLNHAPAEASEFEQNGGASGAVCA